VPHLCFLELPLLAKRKDYIMANVYNANISKVIKDSWIMTSREIQIFSNIVI